MMSSNLPAPSTLLNRYFTELRVSNWAATTIDRRSHSIGRFLTWCGDRGIECVTEITAESIGTYRRSLYHHLRWSGFHGPVRCLAWGHPRSHCNAQVHPAIFGYKTCLHRSIQTRCSRHACRRALG